MNATDAIQELTAWLKLMNHDPDDSTPIEDAVIEGIEALRACKRANVGSAPVPLSEALGSAGSENSGKITERD